MNTSRAVPGEASRSGFTIYHADADLSDHLPQIQGRPHDSVLAALRARVDKAFDSAVILTLFEWNEAKDRAVAELKLAKQRVDEAAETLAVATAAVGLLTAFPWPNLVLWTMAIGVNGAVEFMVTGYGLPLVLDVDPETWLGVALACVPVLFSVAIKLPVDYLFKCIENTAGRTSVVRSTCEGVVHGAIFVMNLLAVTCMIGGREQGMAILKSLQNGGVAKIDETVIHQMIFWLGLGSVLNGAIILSKLGALLSQLGARYTLFRQARKAKAALLEARNHLSLKHKAESERPSVESAEAAIRAACESLRHAHLEKLAEITAREKVPPPVDTDALLKMVLAPRPTTSPGVIQ